MLLKITKDALYFDAQHFVPASKIGLKLAEINEIECFNDRFHWLKVKIRKFDAGTLLCEIIEFDPFEKRVFHSQNVDLSQVQRVLLYSAETFKILNLAKRKVQVKKPAPKVEKNVRPADAIPQKIKNKPKPAPKPTIPTPPPKPKRIKKTIRFSVPFTKLKFHNGYVKLSQYVRVGGLPHGLMIKAKIENDFIKEEFGFIKDYFKNLLKINDVHVTADVLIESGEVTVLKADSPEIKRITSDLIAEVKVRYIKKELLGTREKDEMLTVHQLFSVRGKHNKTVFNVKDGEFIDDLIRIKKPKHGRQIKYLVGLHNYAVLKLRIITNPLSFVFFLPGKHNCYLAWETLFGTDGTYIWALNQNLETLLKNKHILKQKLIQTENEIKKIKESGRMSYLKNKPSNFTRVFHNYKDANGFAVWKKEIERLLSK